MILAIVTLFLTFLPLRAEDVRVDIELVLAVDVSRSMTPRELEIQRRGYAEALVSKEVTDAIARGVYGQIALTYIEWAGVFSQREIVGWTLIRTPEDAQAFADKLTAEFNEALRRTSISGVIDHARSLFNLNGFNGLSHVIDISGDGPNNMGRPVSRARDQAVDRGITINGLPLMTREGMGSQFHLPDLDLYYSNCVIGGPRSFVIPVLEWDAFPEAVRRKLVLELAGSVPRVYRASALQVQNPAYDCLIGEKIWQRFQGDFFNP